MTTCATRRSVSAQTVPLRDTRAHVYRYRVETPVLTSFGAMRERPAVFVRVEDAEGATGWGEIWCNFPDCGAEHRARLIETVFAPLLEGRLVDDPRAVFKELTMRTAVLAIQAGEPGPISQCIAGIDIALWDLAARRAGEPLWRHLGGTSPRVRVYASGINPDAPEELVAARYADGYRAFKLKVGFAEERDLENLRALRLTLDRSCALMVDANQAWNLSTALRIAAKLATFDLGWLEEPLRADRPWSEWRTLADACGTPLAAGENIVGEDAFATAITAGALRIVQPDLAKWGGFSGCLPVARRILHSGLRYCPHYLGAGIGLLASAHLLAAIGGEGMLEVDANPNPLRTLTCGRLGNVADGFAVLDDAPGLGITPELEQLHAWAVSPIRRSDVASSGASAVS
jgi:D-galactarolactone cycloisomerase